MLKQFVIHGSILMLLLGVSLPAYAQEQTPALTSSGELIAQQSEPSAVSDEELDQFITAVVQMESIRADARQEAVTVIEAEGLTPQRFGEILETQRDPEAEASPDVSDSELADFQRALTQIADIQDSARSRMRDAIEAQGMEVERFDEIVEIAQTDQTLQQEIERRLEIQG
ncbi:MAG: DUF4168 domain-containing protein [Elainellaceae cyanobacterium]